MKRKWIIAAVLMIAAGMFAIVSCGKKADQADHPGDHAKDHPAAKAEAPEEKAEVELVGNKTCPVMEGNPVKTDLYVDVKGKRINVCCPGCIDKIKADPDKYLSKLK